MHAAGTLRRKVRVVPGADVKDTPGVHTDLLVLVEYGAVTLAYPALLHLAHGVAWQIFDEKDPFRLLEFCQAPIKQPLDLALRQ